MTRSPQETLVSAPATPSISSKAPPQEGLEPRPSEAVSKRTGEGPQGREGRKGAGKSPVSSGPLALPAPLRSALRRSPTRAVPGISVAILHGHLPVAEEPHPSQSHAISALAAGSRLGIDGTPRYNKGPCFEAFPFPDASPQLRTKIATLAERIDATERRLLLAVRRWV